MYRALCAPIFMPYFMWLIFWGIIILHFFWPTFLGSDQISLMTWQIGRRPGWGVHGMLLKKLALLNSRNHLLSENERASRHPLHSPQRTPYQNCDGVQLCSTPKESCRRGMSWLTSKPAQCLERHKFRSRELWGRWMSSTRWKWKHDLCAVHPWEDPVEYII